MRIYTIFAALAVGILGGCNGSSDKPTPKTSEPRTLVKTSFITSSEVCTNGGLEIAIGTDANGNGKLEKNEIHGYQTVCSGSVGNASLIDIESIQAGEDCANGGSRFSVGVDIDGNGKLSTTELTETSFVCNGSGFSGNDDYQFLIRIRGEGPGESCQFGGSVVLVGSDSNRDGILDSHESITQHYTCYDQQPGENTAPTVPELTILNTALNTPVSATLSADDAENDRLTFSITQPPAHGELVAFSELTGEFTYQPATDFMGEDSFSYISDDGQYQSTQGEVKINTAGVNVPDGHFLINTNNIRFVDYPDGLTPRAFIVKGQNIEKTVTAALPSPAAISALNLEALAEKEEGAVEPSVHLPVSHLPIASGTSKIIVTMVDGPDLERAMGERQLTFSYIYNWQSNGTTLQVAPSPNGEATAIYFTHDGELAVKLKLNNSSSSVFNVDDNNALVFNVASLFDDEQLGTALKRAGMKDGYYSYRVDFNDFPVVDTYGDAFNAFTGGFNVSSNPVPVTQNVNKTLRVVQGQLIQQSVKLSGSGGTGPLTFALMDPATTGTATLTDATDGWVNYAPLSPALLVDDAFSYHVTDEFIDSNSSKVRLNIADDTATTSASLKAVYGLVENEVAISWNDIWQNEIGFRVEKYNESCHCWQTAELLADSPESGLPMTWKRPVTERSYYRVFALLPDGDELLKPGVVVANADYQPNITFDQTSPVEGGIMATLDSASPLISSIDWYVDFAHKCTWRGTYYNSAWDEPACTIDTTRLADGIHAVLAKVALQDASYVYIKSSFNSYNPAPTPTPKLSTRVHKGTSSSTTPDIGEYEIQVRASDDSGISYVELQMDEMAPMRLTAPNSTWYRSQNYCKLYPQYCQAKNAYTWTFSNLLPGSHYYDLVTESNRGEARETTGKLNVPIAIELLSPSDSDITGATLRILGQVGATNNPVRITVTLGNLTVLDTTGTSFDTSVDMRSVASGDYTLRVVVRDVVGGASSTLTKRLKYTK